MNDKFFWLEVSMTVNGELAEAVAEVMARFAPEGVVTESEVKFINEEDEGTPIGDVTVRAYLPADDRLEETRHRLEEALYYLGTIQPLPSPTYLPLENQNWMETWKSRYRPILVGKKLIIVPAWLESTDSTRIAIKIDPGMAFGTGTHPTTQLCLLLIEQFFDNKAIARRYYNVIDVGCGSGILTIAALKLGAKFVLGVDIDEASVRASDENAKINEISDGKFQLVLGSVAEILTGKYQIRKARLALANILAPTIIRLFEGGMAELIEPGGYIILSGILQEQADAVLFTAQSYELKLIEKRQMGDWIALMLQR